MIFYKFYPQNLWHFKDVSIKCPKQFLYYTEFKCGRALEKNSSLNMMYLVGFQASKIWNFFLKNVLWSWFENHFLTVFHMVWKNQESREL